MIQGTQYTIGFRFQKNHGFKGKDSLPWIKLTADMSSSDGRGE